MAPHALQRALGRAALSTAPAGSEIVSVAVLGTSVSLATQGGGSYSAMLRGAGEHYTASVQRHVEQVLAPALVGMRVDDQAAVDAALAAASGGGANRAELAARLGVSTAACRAGADTRGLRLWEHIADTAGVAVGSRVVLPVPCVPAIAGRPAGATNKLPVRSAMFVPSGLDSFSDAAAALSLAQAQLEAVVASEYGEAAQTLRVGAGGVLAPPVQSIAEALDLCQAATRKAGLQAEQMPFAVDAAASHFFVGEQNAYNLDLASAEDAEPLEAQEDRGMLMSWYLRAREWDLNAEVMRGEELLIVYKQLADKYPIVSFEEPFDASDLEMWSKFSNAVGTLGVQVITPAQEFGKFAEWGAASTLLIDLADSGTVTDVLDVWRSTQAETWGAMFLSEGAADTFVDDLVVGVGAGMIKSVGPRQSFSRLLQIEDECGDRKVFAGALRDA